MASSSMGGAYTAAAHQQHQQTPSQQQPPLLPLPPTHHHHRLPETGPPAKMMRREDGGGGAPSMVGQAGMPLPAQKPKGPKLKFTPEDDQLLIDLKENKNLTWKQIADFFPGRSSGTLQVRYCTKLKAKTTQWTDETVCFPSGTTFTPVPSILFDRLTHFSFLGDTGPEAPHGHSRLRERKVAHHCQQGRHGLHAGVLPRAGRGADGGTVIAINVPVGGFGSRVWGHDVPAAASLMGQMVLSRGSFP